MAKEVVPEVISWQWLQPFMAHVHSYTQSLISSLSSFTASKGQLSRFCSVKNIKASSLDCILVLGSLF